MQKVKTNRNAFTIVELVIVIAVIAILAAVLIPTFASLVKKANQSADIQAVKQMNTQLAIIEAENRPETIGAAVIALNEVDINIDNYTPLISGTQFYWVKSENRVVYVSLKDDEGNKQEKILYPDNYKKMTHTPGDWYSLNGDIEFEDYGKVGSDGAVSIGTPGQFAKLVDDINKNQADSVRIIKLTENIDLAGATAKFTAKGNSENQGFSNTIEIDGNKKTIYAFRDDTQTGFGGKEQSERGYGYGLFGNIGKDGKVTIKNLTISDANVQRTDTYNSGTVGIIAGYVYGELNLEDVVIKNSSVVGCQKVGAIAGRMYEAEENHSKVKIRGLTLDNVTVGGLYEIAALIGCVDDKAEISFSSIDVPEGKLKVYRPAVYDGSANGEISGTTYNLGSGSYIVITKDDYKLLHPTLTEKYTWTYSDLKDTNDSKYKYRAIPTNKSSAINND